MRIKENIEVKENNSGTIYILNSIIGKPCAYVGSSKNIEMRMKSYRSSKGKGQKLLAYKINEIGFDDGFQKIFINNIPVDKLELWEGFYIGLFGTYVRDNPRFGLNMLRWPFKPPLSDEKVHKKFLEDYHNENIKLIKSDGDEIYFKSISEYARLENVPDSTARFRVRYNSKFGNGCQLVSLKINRKNPRSTDKRSKVVLAVNLKDNSVKKFISVNECSTNLKIDPSSIRRIILNPINKRNGQYRYYKDYRFEILK